MGHLVLQGGAEFGGSMGASDRRALELAGGADVPVSIIPAAAVPDNNHGRAGEIGRKWFQSLGAGNVEVLPLIDGQSANDAHVASTLAASGLIYLLGGFPGYLMQTLAGSESWRAVTIALGAGAVLAGSSAGAMVLCNRFYDPHAHRVVKGLGLLQDICILPHHDRFGIRWASALQKALPRATLVGIDEETAMINDAPRGLWRIYGPGGITRYRSGRTERFNHGAVFDL